MRSWLPPAVLLLAAFAAPASVHAQLPATAAIEAYDYGFRDPASPGQSAVAVAVGGTVAFSYPSGFSAHNVVFPAAAPTTCTQTAGPVGGPGPLPFRHRGAVHVRLRPARLDERQGGRRLLAARSRSEPRQPAGRPATGFAGIAGFAGRFRIARRR